MSDYTHKIILFTESNFSGDALVVMKKKEVENIRFNLENFQYSDINDNKKNFLRTVNSVIVEAGLWNLGITGVGGAGCGRDDGNQLCYAVSSIDMPFDYVVSIN